MQLIVSLTCLVVFPDMPTRNGSLVFWLGTLSVNCFKEGMRRKTNGSLGEISSPVWERVKCIFAPTCVCVCVFACRLS